MELQLALLHSRLRLFQFMKESIELTGQWLNLQENFRVTNISLYPSSKWSCSLGNIPDIRLLEAHWLGLDQLVHLVPHLLCDHVRVEMQNALDHTWLSKESPHRIPRKVLLSHHPQNTLQHIANGIRRHPKSLDLIQIRRAQRSNRCLRCVDLWLHARQLGLDLLLPLLDHRLVLMALLLENLHLLLGPCTLLQALRDLDHCRVGLRLFLREQDLLIACLPGQLVDHGLCLLEFVQARRQVL